MPRPRRSIPIERLTAATLEEIARELKLSTMAVYYIEQKALKKLRTVFVERKIVTRSGRYDAA